MAFYDGLKRERICGSFSLCDTVFDSSCLSPAIFFLSPTTAFPLLASVLLLGFCWEAFPSQLFSLCPSLWCIPILQPHYIIKHFHDKQFRVAFKIKNIHPEANKNSSLLECAFFSEAGYLNYNLSHWVLDIFSGSQGLVAFLNLPLLLSTMVFSEAVSFSHKSWLSIRKFPPSSFFPHLWEIEASLLPPLSISSRWTTLCCGIN